MSLIANFALILAAIVTKLSSSVDDIVWLIPFVSPTNKTFKKQLCMALMYLSVMCLVTLTAISCAIAGKKILELILNNNQSFWTAESILGLASGIILFLYSIWLFYDWHKERQEQKDNTKDSNDIKATQLPSESTLQSDAGMNVNDTELVVLTESKKQSEPELANVKEDDISDEYNGNKITVPRLIIVCILGSLDDFAIQCALLLGEAFLWYQLLIGVFIGSLIVVIFCVSIGYVQSIVKYIEMVP
eukprot:489185_1